MTLVAFSDDELDYLEETGRIGVIETYFDWPQTHLSEFGRDRR